MRLNYALLRRELFKQGVTQKQLASMTGISRATINGICKGRSCSSTTAQKIAAALNILIDELLEADE